MAEFEITRELMQKAMAHPDIPKALKGVADRVAATAKRSLADAGVVGDVRIEQGVRPGGRPFAKVVASSDQEFGTASTPRVRALGRAAAATRKDIRGALRAGAEAEGGGR